jgi:hypothetical protein
MLQLVAHHSAPTLDNPGYDAVDDLLGRLGSFGIDEFLERVRVEVHRPAQCHFFWVSSGM